MSSERRSPGFYGAKVEDWVLRRYDLKRSYARVNGVRMDAIEPSNGQPVEIKAVASNRRGGRADQTRFKVWRDEHEALSKAGGYYVFVVYRLRSDGIRVQNSRSVRASSVSIGWYGDTKPRGKEQAEIPASELF